MRKRNVFWLAVLVFGRAPRAHADMNSRNASPPGVFDLFWTFLRLGAQGFGGLGAVLALLTRELVERRGWLRESDITEALTYTKLLPGPAIVQIVAYLGWKLRGWPGALVASVAFLIPPFLLMLALAATYRAVGALPAVSAATQGLTAAVVGLLGVTTLTLGRKNIAGASGWLIALLATLASIFFEVHPAALVVAAGLWGIGREALKPQAVKPQEEPKK